MTCTQCGATLNPEAKFCASCGTAVANAPSPPRALPTTAQPVMSPPAAAHYVAPPPPAANVAPAYSPGYAYVQSPKTNGLAIAAMVLGILWLYWLGSILALVFGYVAKNQIDKSGGAEGGRGMAIAGIVLGWIGVAILTIVIIAASASTS